MAKALARVGLRLKRAVNASRKKASGTARKSFATWQTVAY
jgi:hypothetical protein